MTAVLIKPFLRHFVIYRYSLEGSTCTLNISRSPISALSMAPPDGSVIFMKQVGGGPVLAMVPAVVSIDTLKPIVMVFSPVL